MIDNETKNRIKNALNIADEIGNFVNLKRKSNNNYVGCCPFHGDTTPSMHVNVNKGIYKCFACGAGGDIISFVEKHENMSFNEALKWCADKAGIPFEIREMTPEEVIRAKERDSMYVAINAASDFFCNNLTAAEDYIKDRNFSITDELLKEFKVGFAPSDNALHKNLVKAGYNENVLKKVNVIASNDKGYTYDVFRERLVFPFLDLQGRVIGFSGRTVKEPGDRNPKYLNTNETLIYHKGSQLFGLFQARQAISRLGQVYLVEGQFDLLSLHANGVKNVVAGSGTALTSDQIKLIARFTDQVVLVYDADKAGLAASLKNAESFLKAGIKVSCVKLPEGSDPDNIAWQELDMTSKWLSNRTQPFSTYFAETLYNGIENPTPEDDEDILDKICQLLVAIDSETLRLNHTLKLSNNLRIPVDLIDRKVAKMLRGKVKTPDVLNDGAYGLEVLPELLKENEPCVITNNLDDFIDSYGADPILLFKGIISSTDVQNVRKTCGFFTIDASNLYLNRDGSMTDFLASLCELYRAGISNINVVKYSCDDDEDSDVDDGYSENEKSISLFPFIKHFVKLHSSFFCDFYGERTPFVERCIELISYADDSVRHVNVKYFYESLGITKGALNELLKPYLGKRKSKLAINAMRTDDDDPDFDPDALPDYVENNPEYKEMLAQAGYYPKLNKDGEPVCYMFRRPNNSGYDMIADFYMEPLIHIESDDRTKNKRIVKINRKYFKTPIYFEILSTEIIKKSSLEIATAGLVAVNFSNGDEKHWTKIKEYMSRHFITCREIEVYGNQQSEGFSRRPNEQFFAFSNGIFHEVDGVCRFDSVNELGVVNHCNENYYLPAFSTIYAGNYSQKEKYELITQLVYKDIPVEKRCTFEEWASLMDRVYKINDNGKWAVLYAIMCAFRSNIHSIDRLFTALFFMGPMSSGKTQIAISIRSLFVSPFVPIFNLNNGTDAAMSTLMGSFRDVPVVLDEYNNKDISDYKFQALKSIVYDGDGKQKRKGTSSKEIETDKVYTPVVICGQETPQRDDNALMSRIIACEVPKPKNRTQEEVELFDRLKMIEDPNNIGLSNVLVDILKMRPMVMDHFRTLKKQAYDQLKKELANAGELDRLIKTTSLFLATCKLVEDYTPLKLPFTYKDFFPIALSKVKSQVEMISKSDKVATFFNAMDVMIDSKRLIEGRDFLIGTPSSIKVKLSKDENKDVSVLPGKKILYLRMTKLYAEYKQSGMDSEGLTDTTLNQNMRSNPCFIGVIHGQRFSWQEVEEQSKGDFKATPAENDLGIQSSTDNTMIRRMVKKSQVFPCIALDYDMFLELYNIDFRRSTESDPVKQNLDITF